MSCSIDPTTSPHQLSTTHITKNSLFTWRIALSTIRANGGKVVMPASEIRPVIAFNLEAGLTLLGYPQQFPQQCLAAPAIQLWEPPAIQSR
jgi:hypothetical protein